ncbi:MAG: GIY-YIG nuclease family protein, partial [Anaerolineae bacterium]|nr:GIY-YIG nuclease family protein [Anaerolineae bacterium]
MSEPFTLRVFVPSGDPEGTRIIDHMNWTGRAYYVPRDDWAITRLRPELQVAGIYVLLGYEADELGNEMAVAYIGQAESVAKRLDQHDTGKEFWDRAMLFVSANNGLNRAHITWLEWALMAQANRAARCKLDNNVTHSEPWLTESEKADIGAFLKEMLRLMPVMGVHIFEESPAEKAPQISQPKPTPTAPDVIIVPAQPEGFQSAFLDSNAWWAVRVAKKHRINLKWIAAYQTLPVAAITYIAKIDRFEPYGDEGKFKVIFAEPAEKLEQAKPFANAVSGAMQGPRYCTRDIFDAAKTVGG